jgi:RNA polymerase sigma-70 factor (family 1)
MEHITQGDTSDEELITSFRMGDKIAFSSIFNKYYASLCFFTSNIIHNPDEAEDIVQDIFHKLWNKHSDFFTLNELKSFLYIGCRNSSFNYLKRNKAKDGQQQELLRLTDDADQSVLNRIVYVESLREIHTAIDTLPEQCKIVIKMLFNDGKSPQEVAEHLGVTVSTVYNQKMRGVAILRKVLSVKSFNLLLVLLAESLSN